MYIHQRKTWPNFIWDHHKIADLLAEVRYLQGRLFGHMHTLGFQLSEEATLHVLTQDVLKTSEIEGEKLDAEQVRSSIARRLGIDIPNVAHVNRHVEGIVEVLLDATRNYDKPLTKNRLLAWQSALFPTGRSGMQLVTVGEWRTDLHGPMQVISGSYGREKVHYEAPAAERLKHEMSQFIKWFNASSATNLVIKSALAHFWFVTIHPFEDGNDRIARALADMLLAQSEKSPQRFYSMSAQILKERKHYYSVLEQCQQGTLDITAWMEWFLSCLSRAITAAEETLRMVLIKASFWKKYAVELFNDRQRNILNRLLDNEFIGKLNSSKWAKLTKCSQDTALRDINDLLTRKILVKDEAGGRSTSYYLVEHPPVKIVNN